MARYRIGDKIPQAEGVGTEPPMGPVMGQDCRGLLAQLRRLIEPPAVLPVARLGASSDSDGDIDGRSARKRMARSCRRMTSRPVRPAT